jgi:hypothetical protein
MVTHPSSRGDHENGWITPERVAHRNRAYATKGLRNSAVSVKMVRIMAGALCAVFR